MKAKLFHFKTHNKNPKTLFHYIFLSVPKFRGHSGISLLFLVNIGSGDRLHVWWLTQSRLKTLLPSLIARRGGWGGGGGSSLRLNEGSDLKTFNQVGRGSILCLWLGTPGFNCWISDASAFQSLSHVVSSPC